MDRGNANVWQANAQHREAVFALAQGFGGALTLELEAFDATFDRLLADETALLAVATDTHLATVVGYVHATCLASLRANFPIARIEEIFVKEGYRRARIGGQLMSAAVEWGRLRGAASISIASDRPGGFIGRFGYAKTATLFQKPLD